MKTKAFFAPSDRALDGDDDEESTCWEKFKEKCGPGSLPFNLGIIALYVLICALIFEAADHQEFVTMLYVIVQILTTIGYGDITIPKHCRLMAMLFVLVGIVVVAHALNSVVSRLLDARRRHLRHLLRKIEVEAMSSISDEKQAKLHYGLLNQLITATSIFAFFLVSGAVFYRFVEACTCSYATTRVSDCIEGDQCSTTGGYQKDWIDAVYMSVITLTTIGFGDVVPRSWIGRVFGIFWMVFGVLAMANWVTVLVSVFHVLAHKQPKPKFSRKLFMEIDKDKNNALSFGEFCTWALVTQGMITTEDVDSLHKAFQSMDINNTKKLEYEILAKQFGHREIKDEDEDEDEDEESDDLLFE